MEYTKKYAADITYRFLSGTQKKRNATLEADSIDELLGLLKNELINKDTTHLESCLIWYKPRFSVNNWYTNGYEPTQEATDLLMDQLRFEEVI